MPAFKRSTRCGTNACVEVSITDTGVFVRDSKQADGAVLLFTHDEWSAFVGGVKLGEFEAPEAAAVSTP